MLLRLKKIAKIYGNRLIFKGISLEIAPGGITLLVGANGAGKSTLLKIMAGLVRPDEGEVLTELAASDIGYLGHQTFIYPHFSARENLAFWAGLYMPKKDAKNGTHRERYAARNAAIDGVLARVGLQDFAEEQAGAFSRGMAQRLNLARVLMQRPKLLLLDEPTTGLDARSKAVLDGELLAAAEHGAGIVWISHSLEDDLAKADFLVMLENHALAYAGRARDFPLQRAVEPSSC